MELKQLYHSVLLPVSPAWMNLGGVGTTVGIGATEEEATAEVFIMSGLTIIVTVTISLL